MKNNQPDFGSTITFNSVVSVTRLPPALSPNERPNINSSIEKIKSHYYRALSVL